MIENKDWRKQALIYQSTYNGLKNWLKRTHPEIWEEHLVYVKERQVARGKRLAAAIKLGLEVMERDKTDV